MKAPFEELAALDRLVHEPARLSILTALASCESADFLYLQRLTGLSKGNLSSHLSKLEEAGLLVVTKQFKGKTPNTQSRHQRAGAPCHRAALGATRPAAQQHAPVGAGREHRVAAVRASRPLALQPFIVSPALARRRVGTAWLRRGGSRREGVGHRD